MSFEHYNAEYVDDDPIFCFVLTPTVEEIGSDDRPASTAPHDSAAPAMVPASEALPLVTMERPRWALPAPSARSAADHVAHCARMREKSARTLAQELRRQIVELQRDSGRGGGDGKKRLRTCEADGGPGGASDRSSDALLDLQICSAQNLRAKDIGLSLGCSERRE